MAPQNQCKYVNISILSTKSLDEINPSLASVFSLNCPTTLGGHPSKNEKRHIKKSPESYCSYPDRKSHGYFFPFQPLKYFDCSPSL